MNTPAVLFRITQVIYLALVSSIVGATADRSTDSFSVSGSLVWKVFKADDSNDPYETNVYSVSGVVLDQMFKAAVQSTGTNLFVREEVGWDGKDLYSVNQWVGEGSPNKTNVVAHLESNFVPRHGGKQMKALTLALANPDLIKTVFSRTNNGIWILEGGYFIPEQLSRYTLRTSEDGAVSAITAWATNYYQFRQTGFEGLSEEPKRRMLETPYEKGFQHWIYSVERMDPIARRPTAFSLKVLFPKVEAKPKNADDLFIIATVDGRLAYAPTNAPAGILPEVPKERVLVRDHRFRRETIGKDIADPLLGNLIYPLTNAAWDLPTPESMAIRVREVRAMLETEKKHKARPFIMGATVAVLVISPIILLWWGNRRNSSRIQKDNI